jgi:uncharacterized protein (DUF1684 family)
MPEGLQAALPSAPNRLSIAVEAGNHAILVGGGQWWYE